MSLSQLNTLQNVLRSYSQISHYNQQLIDQLKLDYVMTLTDYRLDTAYLIFPQQYSRADYYVKFPTIINN